MGLMNSKEILCMERKFNTKDYVHKEESNRVKKDVTEVVDCLRVI